MSRRQSIARYNIIIKRVRKAAASFKEIEDYLERESEMQGESYQVSKRTFHRDLNDIRALFKIDIQYDPSGNVYFIDNEQSPDVSERLLEAFDTMNAISFTDGISQYIYFEKRRPQGTQHLYDLLNAIKGRFTISFQYQKFWNDEVTQRLVAPYALREFRNRWYLIAKDGKDEQVKTFGLDRLHDVEITKKHFSYPESFNVEIMFANCFGIIGANGRPPQDIVLSFSAAQGKYIKSLPLHESQSVILDNKDVFRIQLRLCLTHDFIMELLSYGEEVTVVAPAELKKTMRDIHTKASLNNR